MEKKIVARALQATKGTSTDSKFKQDGQQKFPRTPRKREGARSDPSKKPITQRNRTSIDKRPRPRGVNLWERDGSEVVEDALAEAGSMLQHGQKKINLNHLLNFKLAPREVHPQVREKAWLPKYNKEQFLQANCQFVVKQDGEYVRHASDPDLLVDWNHVEEVRVPCFEETTCPICLYQPTAAKITRCGHIYCWPCILHYLALSSGTCCKCPICHEPVSKKDLKSVMPASKVAPAVHNEISLCLMQRKKGQLHALPVSGPKSAVKYGLFTIHDDLSTTCFQKLLTATKKDVQHFVIDREMIELQKLRRDADESELVFIEESLELLKKRHDSLIYEEPFDSLAENLKTVSLENESPCGALSSEISPSETQSDAVASSSNGNFGAQDSYFYFYQATDGQHIYLHPLNIRMLVEEYGSLEQSPEIIKAKIIDIERVTVTDNVRRRLHYLQHLPLTCEFQVVELRLQPLISKTTSDLFSAEVEKRRRTRNRKAREERRRDKRIELEENKKIGKYPEARYCLDSTDHFPLCPNDLLNLDDHPLLENSSTDGATPVASPSSSETATGATSFAQMLRSAKAKPDFVRERPRSVPNVAESIADVEDEAASPPAYWQSFSSALDSCAIQQGSGKGKKKKNKTLLFSTAINRSK